MVNPKELELINLKDTLQELLEDGELKSVRVRGDRRNYLEHIKSFKEYCKIETDDVITIVDMYFANEFSVEYIGKTIFD